MVQIHGIRRASADAKYRQMTGQPVKPLILKLCLPAVISNLVTTAYNLTDTFFIGQLGTAQSGAIGIAFSIMTVMQALGFFFGNGAGNSMSRELGKQNNERASRLLAVGFAGAVLSGLVIATIGLLTLRPLVVMLGSTSTIAPYAVQYLTPLLVAAPCVCGSFALNGLLRYQGQSTFGMIGLVSGALLNFLLAPLFIFVLHLGIFGAGLATAICQTVSFTILTTMSRKFGVMKLSLRNCRPDVLLMREVAGGGLPSLIRQGAGSISVTCVNIAANPFGDAAIAGMAIVMRIMLGANSVIVGLGQGFQPVCGYNYGAGLFARVKEGYWFCVRLATCVLVVLAVLLWVFAPVGQEFRLFRHSTGYDGSCSGTEHQVKHKVRPVKRCIAGKDIKARFADQAQEILASSKLKPMRINTTVPIQKSIRFFMMMLPAFLARVNPASTIAKPACIQKTSAAPIRNQTPKI